MRKALAYPLKLVASNAGAIGSVVMQRVIEESATKPQFGWNAATDKYSDDLLAEGVVDPTKVIRCCLENAVSVAKTFLLADVVVVNAPEPAGAMGAGAGGGGAGDYGY